MWCVVKSGEYMINCRAYMIISRDIVDIWPIYSQSMIISTSYNRGVVMYEIRSMDEIR